MSEDYIEDPSFDNGEEMQSREPTSADWTDEPRIRAMKTDQDIRSIIIQPSTKTSYKIGKGKDPISQELKTGVVPSGYMEANSIDLATANLKIDSLPKNYDERLNMACNMALSSLKAFSELTNIDVSLSYAMVLETRDLYNTTTKARMGKLLEYAFTNRSSTIAQRIDTIQDPNTQKKSLTDKVFGDKDKYE